MIRDMSLYDTLSVCEMLVDLRNESPEYAFVEEDWNYVPQQLNRMICDPDFIGIIDDDYRGFMIGSVQQHWYSSRRDAYEQLLWIGAPYRGTALAPRLIKAFEAKARSLGAVNLYAGASTGMNEERTIQLYERLGYTRLTAPVRKKL
ncbi:N-acetyltransferase protein [Rhizobium phage RHph_X3_9]|nr:N-acetyltransferase protein [Rhizobium phage RHph_X3_9]